VSYGPTNLKCILHVQCFILTRFYLEPNKKRGEGCKVIATSKLFFTKSKRSWTIQVFALIAIKEWMFTSKITSNSIEISKQFSQEPLSLLSKNDSIHSFCTNVIYNSIYRIDFFYTSLVWIMFHCWNIWLKFKIFKN